MKLVSYNILNGGVGRADPLIEVVAAQTPDTVVLIESTDAWVLDRMARRLGFDVICAESEHGAVAVLTRGTIVSSRNLGRLDPTLGKGAIEVEIKTDEAGTVRVVAADEPDEAALLRVLGDRRADVIAGTFGADDWTGEDDGGDVPAIPAGQGGPPAGVSRPGELELAGYVDAAKSLGNAEKTHPTQNPTTRPDRIYCSGQANAKVFHVEHHRLATYASDHYPAICDFDLTR